MTEKEALKLALEAYLCREMPAGTVIGDPKWWAAKIANAIKEALAQPEKMHIEKNMTLACPSYLHDYTTPPQRKPLSDEEIYSLADSLEIWNEDDEEWILDPNTFARAIEAAHGIKG